MVCTPMARKRSLRCLMGLTAWLPTTPLIQLAITISGARAPLMPSSKLTTVTPMTAMFGPSKAEVNMA